VDRVVRAVRVQDRLGWARAEDLLAYFPAKRRWVYSVYLLGLVIAVMGSYMKGGWTDLLAQGGLGWAYPGANPLVVALGLRARRLRRNTIMGIVSIVWLVVFGFEFAPLLHR